MPHHPVRRSSVRNRVRSAGAALLGLAMLSGQTLTVGAAAGAAERPPGPQVLRGEEGGLSPQWAVPPAPNSDCPTGSVRTVVALTDSFEPGATGRVQLVGADVLTEDGDSFARNGGVSAPGTTFLTTGAIPVQRARLYVKFEVRGTFGVSDLAVAPNNGGGGWFVRSAAAAGVSPDTWRTVRLDMTDGANETTWGTALRLQWLRDRVDGTTVDVDDVEVYQCTPPPSPEPGDVNGDGLADPKFIMRDGTLIAAAGTLTSPTSLWRSGSGWGAFTWIASAGDVTGDGRADLLARASNGDLLAYPGDGVRSFGRPTRIGAGWNGMTSIITVGDVNRDGHQDLIARGRDGLMRFYSAGAGGRLTGGTVVGQGWGSFRAIMGIRTSVTPGTPTRLYAATTTGVLLSYTVQGNGRITGTGKKVGGGWKFRHMTSVGDFDGDGLDDLIAVSAAGAAYIYPTAGDGLWKARLTVPETIWHAATVVG